MVALKAASETVVYTGRGRSCEVDRVISSDDRGNKLSFGGVRLLSADGSSVGVSDWSGRSSLLFGPEGIEEVCIYEVRIVIDVIISHLRSLSK